MAVVLHIFKRDLRALWILLSAECVLLVFQAARLWHETSSSITYGHFSFSLIFVLYLIIMAILVRLIHEDPLVGASPFWMTRPISRKSLLLAKGLFVFIFLIFVPVAADFVVMIHFGLKPSQILPFLFTMLSMNLAIICACASLAVVTPNLSSFAAAAAIALVCQFVANNWLPIPKQNGWLFSYRLFELLFILVTLSAVVHQYLTRKTLRSCILLIVGIPFVWLSCHFSMWNALMHPIFGTQEREDFSSIKLIAGKGTVRTPFQPPNDATINKNISWPVMGTLDLLNVRAPEVFLLTRLNGRLEFSDGKMVSSPYIKWSKYFGVGNALSKLLPGFEGSSPDESDKRMELLSVNPSQYKELYNRTGTYTGEAQFEVYRDSIVSDAPLVLGNSINLSPYSISISDIDSSEPGRLRISLNRLGLTTDSDRGDEMYFCVLNRTRQQALSSFRNQFSPRIDHVLILLGVDLSRWNWSAFFSVPVSSGRPDFAIDNAWLAEARIVAIKRARIGSFSKKFVIKNFRIIDYTVRK